MKKKLFSFLLILFIFVCTLFANATTENVNKSNNIRIVSLAPNVTEIICELGAEENLVGRTAYCNYPAFVTEIQNIGDMYDPNLELIISLQPDVVIASSIVSPTVVEQLKNYGINTYQFFHEYEGLNGALTLIEEIGNVINKQNEAKELISKLQNKVNEVVSKTSKSNEHKTCAVLVTWGDWGDYAATGDTFIDDIIIKSGAENIAKESTYWAISKELLIAKDPDYIFITDTSNIYSDNMIEMFKNTEPYNNLKASRNNNVYLLNSDSISRLSVRCFDDMEYIAKTLNPDLFK